MKKIFSTLILTLLTLSSIAATPAQVSVSIDLNIHQHEEMNLAKEYYIKNTMNMVTNQHEWTQVKNTDLTNPHSIVLLSRMDQADAEQVKMSFLVIDAGKNPAIISKPELVVRYGEKGQIALRTKHDKMQLIVEAKA